MWKIPRGRGSPYLHRTNQWTESTKKGAGLSCELTAVVVDDGTSLAMATITDESGP